MDKTTMAAAFFTDYYCWARNTGYHFCERLLANESITTFIMMWAFAHDAQTLSYCVSLRVASYRMRIMCVKRQTIITTQQITKQRINPDQSMLSL